DLRALRTSEGSLLPHMKGGVRGALVDPRLRRTLVATAFTTEAWRACALRASDLASLPNRRLSNRPRVFAPESGAPYVPIGSLHLAAAMKAARLVRPTPLAMLYAARLANLVFWTALVAAALWLIPAMRLSLLAIAVAPTALFVASTCSLDGPMDALAFLWFAIVLRLARRPEEPLRRGTTLALVALGAVLALVKLVYFPLVLLLLLVPAARSDSSWRPWIMLCVASLALGVAAIGVWLCMLPGPASALLFDPIGTGEGASRQMLADPVGALGAVVRTIRREALPWIINLAWPLWTTCTIAYPATVAMVWGAWALALLLDAEAHRPTGAQRLVAFGVFVCILVMSVLVAFAAWTPQGESRAVGVQGRYLIPALPALALAVLPPSVPLRPSVRRALLSAIVVALATSLVLVQVAFVRQYDWSAR
ncbi:MAG: DUF2142 domain-containing protein, partial [Deltaproteobacteria bacterium]|nr:DUF2142 domain-containing protein [Deltaproteobacteria bacterium]